LIRDTVSFNEACKVGGEAKNIMMSTDYLLFTGKDDYNKEIICLMNFGHNKQCNRVQTKPLRTLPIGFFSDKDLASSHFVGT
jgi:hypothetical protein